MVSIIVGPRHNAFLVRFLLGHALLAASVLPSVNQDTLRLIKCPAIILCFNGYTFVFCVLKKYLPDYLMSRLNFTPGLLALV